MQESPLLVCRNAFITIGDVIDSTAMHVNDFPRHLTRHQQGLILTIIYYSYPFGLRFNLRSLLCSIGDLLKLEGPNHEGPDHGGLILL